MTRRETALRSVAWTEVDEGRETVSARDEAPRFRVIAGERARTEPSERTDGRTAILLAGEPRLAHEAPSLGSPAHWARDLALVFGISALSVALLGRAGLALGGAATVLATLAGAALGGVMPRLFHPRVRTKPTLLLLGAGAGLGACTGTLAAVLAALLTGSPVLACAELGARLGLMQLGWAWLPMLLLHARRRPTLPIVAMAALLAPMLAAAALAIP